MAIGVLSPGPLTTVQDLGRFGYQQFGIPCSGVMDEQSYRTANELLGNRNGEAVLEFTLFGGSYFFDADAVIALTGADMAATLGGAPCPSYRPVFVPAGSTLMLGVAKSGCRAYLAVAGGINVPPVLGSRSTNLKCKMGGFEGRALRAGDVLPVGLPAGADILAAQDTAAAYYEKIRQNSAAPAVYSSEITVRAIPGPQDDRFTSDGLHTFFSCSYKVSEQSDRMGCRLDGPAVESIGGTDIVSDGIVFGSVQVTPAGQPIVLMADRQTTGGYAKIATVLSADLPLLAQVRPGDTVRFQKTEVASAFR